MVNMSNPSAQESLSNRNSELELSSSVMLTINSNKHLGREARLTAIQKLLCNNSRVVLNRN